MIPTSIDGTDITGATIDGTDVQEITVDGDVVFSATSISPKAVHQWKLDDVNGTMADSIGNADATNQGLTSVNGNFVGGSAAQGDGSSTAEISASDASTINSLRDQPHAWSFTIETSSSAEEVFIGETISAPRYLVGHTGFDGANADTITILVGDSSSNQHVTTYSTTINDGQKYRVTVNWTGSNGVKDAPADVFINNSPESSSITRNQSLSNVTETEKWYLGSWGGSNSEMTGILDNVIFYNDSLTSQEIADDYNLQPWS